MRLREAFINTLTGNIGTWRDWQYSLPVDLHIRDIIESFNYYIIKIEDINVQGRTITYCNSKRYTSQSSSSFPKLFKINLPEELLCELTEGFYLIQIDGEDWIETIKFPNQQISFVKRVDSVISSLYNLVYNGNIPNLDYSNLNPQEQKKLKKWQNAQAKRFISKNWNEKGAWPAANEPAWQPLLSVKEADAIMNELTIKVHQLALSLPEEELKWFNHELSNIHVGDMRQIESYHRLQREVDKLVQKLQLVKVCLTL